MNNLLNNLMKNLMDLHLILNNYNLLKNKNDFHNKIKNSLEFFYLFLYNNA